MRLRFTLPAASELDAILSHIEAHSPAGARRVQRRLQRVLAVLLQHPQAGQKTRRPGMRRIVVTPYPYLVFYRLAGDEIVVHGVRHGARKPQSLSEIIC